MQLSNPAPTPMRQSPVALVFLIGTFLKRIAFRAWPFLIIALKPNGNGKYTMLVVVLISLAVISLVSGLIAYYKTYFWLDEDSLHLETGLIKKSKVSVPFDRIQSINTEQSLLFRLFSLVKIEVDTAGAKGSEVKIHAIPKELSAQINEYVIENKKAISTETNAEGVEDQVETVSQHSTEVLSLSPWDLFRIGLAQNHFNAIMIIVAFLFSRFQEASELMGENFGAQIDEFSNSEWFSDILLVVFMVAFVFLISVLVSMVMVFTRFFGFKLTESIKGMKTEGGLFTRRQQNISFKRTQLFQYTAGPVRKFIGMYNVKVFQAAAEGPNSSGAVQIPGCPADQIQHIKSRFFEGKEAVSEMENRIHKVYIFRKWIFNGLPALIGLSALALILENYWIFIPAVLYTAYDIFRHALIFKYFRYGFSDDLLSVRSGFWILKYRTLQLYKIQSVEIFQGIYQRQHDYADLILYTAGGSVTIPYIGLKEANLLKNFVLYKVESSAQKWM